MQQKIVILTGSFNPPTLAHLRSIQAAMDLAKGEEPTDADVIGYLVPTSAHYIKEKMLRAGDGFALSDETRNAMLSVLCKEDSRLVLGTPEKENSTHLTIREIAEKHPGAILYFVVGADKLSSLPNWKNAEHLISTTRFIVIDRGKKSAAQLIHANELLRKYTSSFRIMPALAAEGDVSSTRVRTLFREGNPEYRKSLLPGVADILDTLDPSEYKDPEFSDTIRALMKNGRFGNQKALNRVAEKNAELFPLPGDGNLLSGSKVYSSEFRLPDSPDTPNETKTGCINTDLAGAAELLASENLRPAILSTASRIRAAGGYAGGDNTSSEEELCRVSDLSRSLYSFGNPKLKAVKESGVPNKGNAYPLDIRFGGIWSPGVTFFRNGKRELYSLRKETFTCPVVSVPTLSNREKEKDRILIEEKQYFDAAGRFTSEGSDVEKDKIRTAFRIAGENGCDSIVIGDFGIAYHKLPGEELAELFLEVISEAEFKGRFKAILFAFDEGKGNKRYPVEEKGKFGAFYRTFGRFSSVKLR